MRVTVCRKEREAIQRSIDFGMSRLNTQEIERFRANLERMRETVRADEASGQTAAKPVMLGQASVGRLSRMDAIQGQSMAIETQRRREIVARDIDLALARIAAGDYGVCRPCTEDIDPRRLEVDPTVSLCIACASARESS